VPSMLILGQKWSKIVDFIHAGSMSELEPKFRFLRRENIEDPKMDLVQVETSAKVIDSIASFTSSMVISIVDKGMSRILAPSSFNHHNYSDRE
jgi:hypothetical protein